MKVIETELLTKTFRTKLGRPVKSLQELNLEVSAGTIFGFIGPNGAGKTTTIKLLMNFLQPTSGSARLSGFSVRDPESRKNVGYLPENPRYHGYLTPLELLEMAARLHRRPKESYRPLMRSLLERLDLSGSAKRPISTFSKGMTQRLGLATALITEPSLLILDEPMSGLDPIGRHVATELMIELKQQGTSIFFSSHILHDIEVICDHVGILLEGRLRYVGGLDEILDKTFQCYEVRIKAQDQETIRNLADQDVPAISHEDGTVTFMVPKDRMSEQLNAFMSNSWKIVGVQPHRKSLEDFFMEFLSTEPAE